MKVNSSLILKPDAKLQAVKIDFSDPKLKQFLKDRKERIKVRSFRYPAHV